jgi:hypothetical protein
MGGMIKHRARLPHGYAAEFIWTGDGMTVEWDPDLPRIRSRRAWNKFRAAYNRERRTFMELLATTIPGSIMVADTDGPVEVVRPAVKH